MDLAKIIKGKSKQIIQFIIIFLLTLLIFSTFKPLLYLIGFISLNELLRFIKQNTSIEFGFEHVTVAAVIMGRISSISFALLGIAIMIFMKEVRNDQFGFHSLGIKTFFWILMVIISHSLADYSLAIVGISLVSFRFIVFDFILPLKGGGGHDIHMDTINWFYNVFIIKILSYFI